MVNCEKYKPTYILITLNVAIYIAALIFGGPSSPVPGEVLPTPDNIVRQWGQVNLFVVNGYYGQLITSMFIHASLIHLVGNMLFLLIFGLRAEEMFSLPEYIGIYLLGGLAGNLLYLATGVNAAPAVGASGAIFSIFAAAMIYDRRSIKQSIIGALIFIGFFFILNIGVNTNLLAHLGGIVVGLALGYIIASRRKPSDFDTEFKYRITPF